MSYKEFWEEDPEIFWAYHFYYYKKQEIELEKINFNSWLNGLYIYNAVSVSLSNAFKTKGSQPDEYIGQPIELKPKKEKLIEEKVSLDVQLKERAMKIKKMLEKKSGVVDDK